MEISLNGRTVDLSKVLPIRIKDKKALEAQGITDDVVGSGKWEPLSKYLLYLFRKADPSWSMDDVDNLGEHEVVMVLNAIRATRKEMGLDVPFPPDSSTSSPERTAGTPTTSSS